MQNVLGIGGFFFRGKDPAALSEWYHVHLGIVPPPADYGLQPWVQEKGPTVLAPFPQNTEYFGSLDQSWMINFRVRDLDAMVEQLRASGIEVCADPQVYPNGRFARLHDPDGNPIELWQPA